MGTYLLILIVVLAVRYAWGNAGDDYRKLKAGRPQPAAASAPRRAAASVFRDAGYWAHQAAHAFPAFRYGLASGWHTGRGAVVQARTAHVEARAGYLEAAAALRSQVDDYRERRREALAQAREGSSASLPGAGGSGEGSATAAGGGSPVTDYGPGPWALTARSKSGRKISAFKDRDTETIAVWDEADLQRRLAAAAQDPDMEVTVKPLPPAAATYSCGAARSVAAWPMGADAGKAHSWARQMGTQASPWVVTEYPPGGGPGRTIATYDGTEPAPAAGAVQENATEGTSTMAAPAAADATYAVQLDAFTKIRDEAEQEYHAIRRERLKNHLETLMSLRLDRDSLNDAAEIDDALRESEKAAQKLFETADTARAGLQRRHGGVQEAVDSAPIDLPADPGFYAR